MLQQLTGLADRDGDQERVQRQRGEDDTVTPYAPSAALVVTTVTPEANRPAACRKVCPESCIIPGSAPCGP